jgi:hypothetical protein
MAEALVLIVAAAAVAVVGSAAAFGDVGTMASAGCTARLAVEDLDGLESLQKQRDRKVHAVAEVLVVVAAVPFDPGDTQGLTLSHLASWSTLTEFAHMQEQ